MNRKFFVIILLFISTAIFGNTLLAQEQEKEKTTEEMAAEEAEKLEISLKLEPHQVFFVDSILQHDMKAMKDEFDYMQRSGMREVSSYETVRQKWLDQISNSYKKIFTEEQYIKYLKSIGKYKKEKKNKKKSRN